MLRSVAVLVLVLFFASLSVAVDPYASPITSDAIFNQGAGQVAKESTYFSHLLSKAFAWYTSSGVKLDGYEPNFVNDWFGFAYFRYVDSGLATANEREKAGRRALTLLTTSQKTMFFNLVSSTSSLWNETLVAKTQATAELFKLLTSYCATIDDSLVISSMSSSASTEAQIGVAAMHVFVLLKASLTSDQVAALAAVRNGDTSVKIDATLFNGLSASDAVLAKALASQLFAFLTGSLEQSQYFPLGRPANPFGLYSLEGEANDAATIDQSAADQVQLFLDGDQFSREIFYGATKNAKLLFLDYTVARQEAVSYLYTLVQGSTNALSTAVAARLGEELGKADAMLSISQANAFARAFHRLSPANYSALVSYRQSAAKGTATSDFGPAPSNTPCSPTLKSPPAVRSSNGVLCMPLRVRQTHVVTEKVAFMTRGYEGSIPAPTIRIRPGDVVHIHLRNELEDLCGATTYPECYQHCHTKGQVEGCPTTTNLHTHGLHVSGMGLEDNVLRVVEVGESIVHQYHISADHAPGMNIYHPHFHGSTGLHVMGGMVGTIIVEDDPTLAGYTAELAAMKEDIVEFAVLYFLPEPRDDQVGTDRTTYTAIQALAMDSLFPRPVWNGNASNIYVVNGQYQPTVRVQPGELRRLRMVNAAVAHFLEVGVDGDKCEMWLLARDGIYLRAPSLRTVLMLGPANRVDIALRCNSTGTFSISGSKSHGGATSANMRNNFFAPIAARYEGILMYVEVAGAPVSMKVPSTLPAWPTYLPDLTKTAPDPNCKECFIDLILAGLTVNFLQFPHEYVVPPGQINDGAGFFHNGTINTVQEWRLWPSPNHPLHTHVNHFMLVECTDCDTADWGHIGEYRDTFPFARGTYGNMKIRMFLADHPGTAVTHCHFVQHEDVGMMVFMNIKNADGTSVVPSYVMEDIGCPAPLYTDSILKINYTDAVVPTTTTASVPSTTSPSFNLPFKLILDNFLARGLPNLDSGLDGKTDPYMVVNVTKADGSYVVRRTSTKNDTLSTRWPERFNFGSARWRTVEVSIYDDDQLNGAQLLFSPYLYTELPPTGLVVGSKIKKTITVNVDSPSVKPYFKFRIVASA